MPDSKKALVGQLERDLVELRRQRSMYENNSSWSSDARRRAVAKIDAEIASKKAELSKLKSR